MTDERATDPRAVDPGATAPGYNVPANNVLAKDVPANDVPAATASAPEDPALTLTIAMSASSAPWRNTAANLLSHCLVEDGLGFEIALDDGAAAETTIDAALGPPDGEVSGPSAPETKGGPTGACPDAQAVTSMGPQQSKPRRDHRGRVANA